MEKIIVLLLLIFVLFILCSCKQVTKELMKEVSKQATKELTKELDKKLTKVDLLKMEIELSKREVDFSKLEEKKGKYYLINENQAFTGFGITYSDDDKPIEKKHFIDGELIKKDNNKEGERISYYGNGNILAKSFYKDNKLEGEETIFYENGNIKEQVYFEKGKREGKSFSYYENGNIKSKSFYKDDMRDGERIRYYENENESIWYKYYYKDGKLDGDHISYYKNGSIWDKHYYKDHKLEGECISYYENGNIKSKTFYKEGKREGKSFSYYENGNIKEKKIFIEAKPEGENIYYHENGEIKEVIILDDYTKKVEKERKSVLEKEEREKEAVKRNNHNLRIHLEEIFEKGKNGGNDLDEFIRVSKYISEYKFTLENLSYIMANYTAKLMSVYLESGYINEAKIVFYNYVDNLLPLVGLDNKSKDVASIGICLKNEKINIIIFDKILGEYFNIKDEENEILLFNLACYYSVKKDKESMLRAVRQSLKKGKTGDEFLSDKDFESYYEDEDFLKLVK